MMIDLHKIKDCLMGMSLFIASLTYSLVAEEVPNENLPPRSSHSIQEVGMVSLKDVESYLNAGQFYNNLGQYQKAIEIYLRGLRDYPSDHDLVLALAYAYLFDGQTEESFTLFQEALRSDVNSVDALIGMGSVKEALKQPKEAQQYYIQALNLSPSREDIKLAIKRTRDQEQELRGVEEKHIRDVASKKEALDAIPYYLQLIELNPHQADYYYLLGLAYRKTDELELAVKALKQALDILPNYMDAQIALAYAYLAGGALEESHTLFENILINDPNNVDALLGLGNVKESLSQFVDAEKIYMHAANLDPSRADVKEALHQLKMQKTSPETSEIYLIELASQKEPAQAIPIYLQLINLNPNHGEYYYLLGQAYRKTNQLQLAKEFLQQAIHLQPRHQDAQVALGYVYFAVGQINESRALFEEILEENPDNVDALLGLGKVFETLQKTDKAKELYYHASALSPTREDVQQALKRIDLPPEKVSQVSSEEKELLDLASQKEPKEAIHLYQKLIKMNPQNADYHYLLGHAYRKIDQIDQAIEALHQAILLNPHHFDAQVDLGFVYLADKQVKESQDVFENLLKEDPDNVDAMLGLGRVYEGLQQNDKAKELYYHASALSPNREDVKESIERINNPQTQISSKETELLDRANNKEPPEAIPLYQELIEMNPLRADYHFLLGQAYKKSNQPSLAMEAFKKTLEIQPEHHDAEVGLAYLYLANQDLESSEFLFEKALQENPTSTDALLGLALIKERQGQKEEAQALYYQILAINPDHQEALQLLGRLQQKEPPQATEETQHPLTEEQLLANQGKQLMDSQQYTDAILLYEHLLKQHPSNTEYLLFLGEAYMRNNEHEEAKNIFRYLLSTQPTNEDARVLLAYTYLSEQNPHEAEALFEDVLKENPHYLDAVVGLGRVRELQGRNQEAEYLYTEALALDPKRRDVLDYLVRLHPEKGLVTKPQTAEEALLAKEAKDALTTGQNQKAIELYQKLIQQNPKAADYYLYLGQALTRSDQRDKAIEAFNKVLEIEPKYEDARIALGSIYLFKQDIKKSEEYFQTVLSHQPNNGEALVGLGRVRVLQNKKNEAKVLFEKALKINPHDELALNYLKQLKGEKSDLAKDHVPAWADEMYKDAVALERLEKNFLALELYAYLTAAFPKNGDYRFKLAKMYQRTNQRDLARQTFFDVLQINPDYEDARVDLAYMYLQDQDVNTARFLFQVTLEHTPKHAEALAGMGRIAMLAGDLEQAEFYFTRALCHDPNLEYALNFYGQVLMQENRYFEAKPRFVRLMKILPKDLIVKRTLFWLREYTDPTVGIGGIKAIEEEKDRFTGRLVARLIEWHKRYELILPVTDRFRLFGRGSLGAIRQVNLGTKINTFNAWIHTHTIRGLYLLTPQWTFDYWAMTVSASNRSKGSVLPTLASTLFIPGVSATYDDNHYRFNLHATDTYLLTKDFTIQKTYLIRIRDTGAYFEKLYDKYQRRIGAGGDYFWYEDRVNNQAFWLSGWAQTGILHPYEDIFALRYQVDYRRFKELIPDYYTFEYQLTHWLNLRFIQTWDDTLRVEAEYWHGWRWTKGRNPASQLVTVTLVNTPITKVYSYIDRVWVNVIKVMSDRLMFRATGQMSRDSFDYTTWAIEGNALYRF